MPRPRLSEEQGLTRRVNVAFSQEEHAWMRRRLEREGGSLSRLVRSEWRRLRRLDEELRLLREEVESWQQCPERAHLLRFLEQVSASP